MPKDTDNHLLRFIYACCKKAFIYIGLFSLFINLLMLTVPLYMMQVFDRVLAGHSYQTLIFLTIIAIFALAILSVLEMIRLRIAGKISQWLDEVLNPLALLYSPDEIIKGNAYPEVVLRDIAQLKSTLSGQTLFTLFDAPWAPIYLLVTAAIAPLLGLIGLIGALLLLLIAIINQKLTQRMQAHMNDSNISHVVQASSQLRHAEAILSMGMVHSLIKNWQSKNKPMLELAEKINQTSSKILSISKFIRLLLQIFVYAIGAYLVLANDITAGMMIAASILVSRALAPIDQAIGAWSQFQNSKQILGQLKRYFSTAQDRKTGIKLPKPKGVLHLDGVYFSSPRAGKPIIHGVNLTINPGNVVALIGPSAAGKTTLARLMCGILKPGAGVVRLDAADVYDWDRADFGQHVGYLPQDIELFQDSVKANIARLGDIDDAKVIDAAKLAGCHEMILTLPDGYETMIHPQSHLLSGGQRQRLALARALYGSPQLVVLDEPNANLDNDGEQALFLALAELKKRQATVVVISHKPNVLQSVDAIVVMQEGTVVMSGPRQLILKELQQSKANYQPRSSYGMG